MRIIAFITQASVIDQILAHLRARVAREPRSPPSTRAPTNRGASRAPSPPRRHDRPLSTAPSTPRHHAGTFGVRGRSTGGV